MHRMGCKSVELRSTEYIARICRSSWTMLRCVAVHTHRAVVNLSTMECSRPDRECRTQAVQLIWNLRHSRENQSDTIPT